MKRIVYTLTVVAIVFAVSSCGNKKKKDTNNAGSHVHEDGTVHAGETHIDDNTAKPAQEAFEVEADNDAEHKHEKSEGSHEGHDHGDDAGHDHDHDHGEHN